MADRKAKTTLTLKSVKKATLTQEFVSLIQHLPKDDQDRLLVLAATISSPHQQRRLGERVTGMVAALAAAAAAAAGSASRLEGWNNGKN